MNVQRLPFHVDHAGTRLHGSRWVTEADHAPHVLALHGGGVSTHLGAQWLMAALAAQGWPGAGFDFVGHGETGGALEGSSLDHRIAQARAVAEALPIAAPRVLVASSMGGHIACRSIVSLRPRALVLFCPAAYAAAAESQPFGPAFQRTLRATTDFDASPAFAALERFDGRLLLVLGSEDAVIPPAVVAAYRRRARAAERVEVLMLEGAGHLLHRWLAERPQEAARVQARVLAMLDGLA
ncbi:MAG: alpha/beta fold hydrolase [Pseudomonadota bacterium]|nr:alpha/beta fold hydrolase [Pseudomonadota bacterium]